MLAGMTAAAAAPNIPSSELPGRDRQRFQEQPLDRFTQPPQKTKPLWRWDCEDGKPRGSKKRRSKRCKQR
jgi:hypothetical protein